MKIGLISDTHSRLDEKVFDHFKDVDEIWHAGDFGSLELSDRLASFKPLKGVYGNIDGKELRAIHPEYLLLENEGVKTLMIHIGGYPGRYSKRSKELIEEHHPDLFICGHSHILKVMRDPNYNNMLCINPGAAGVHGFHKMKTIMRFELSDGKVQNVEVIELGKRGKIK